MNSHKSNIAAKLFQLPALDLQMARADKLASSTINLGLSRDLLVTRRCEAAAGNVALVRALDCEPEDLLELVTGQMERVSPGEVIAGVLGYRRALRGFTGDVPDTIEAGDRLHILNLGGLIGRCTGRSWGLNKPIEVEVIGMPARDGRIMNIADNAIRPVHNLEVSLPLVLVAGACMNSGKTNAAVQIIKHLSQSGLRVAAAKLTGVACLRDTLNMKDHGAIETLSFLDCGMASTVGIESLSPFAKGIIARLAGVAPDCIIIELGDGILGGYGVDTFFNDRQLMSAAAAVVFCASDFVGVWGGREILAGHNVRIDVISGPVTDTRMGTDYVRDALGLCAANAVNDGDGLSSLIIQKLEAWTNRRAA